MTGNRPPRPPTKPIAVAAPAVDLWAVDGAAGEGAIAGIGVGGFLSRHWPVFLGVTSLTALLAFTALAFAFNTYSASALIFADPRGAKVTASPEVLANIGPDSIAIESLVQVARSDGFLGEVADAQHLNLAKDEEFAVATTGPGAPAALIERLRDRLTITRKGSTYVIEVAAVTKNPEKSAVIANAVAQAIVKEQALERTGSSRRAADLIGGQLAALRAQVRSAENAAAALRSTLKITSAGQGATVQERKAADLSQQLTLASARKAETGARIEALRRASPANLPADVQSIVLSGLRADHARLTRQLADQSTVLGDRHPAVISLKAELADSKAQIAAEIDRLVTGARAENQAAEGREAALRQQLDGVEAQSGALGSGLVQLGDLEREAKASRDQYEQLLARQKELTELANIETNDVRIVSAAIPPARNQMPRLPITAGASLALGLLAGLAAAFWRESTRPRASAEPSDRDGRGAPGGAMGGVPLLRGRALREQIGDWVADIAPLAAGGADGRGRLTLVTSALEGEGKSTIAHALAADRGRAGDNVLLVEAGTGGGGEREGLLDALRDKRELADCILEHRREAYSVLPLGRTGPDMDALLSAPAARAALAQCAKWFEVVLIDGPVARAPYAASLAQAADRTLLVRATASPQAVREAKSALAAADVRMVANKVV